MKELDLLLNRFLDDRYRGSNAAMRAAFDRLLEIQDPLLYDYFVGRRVPPDADLAVLVDLITATC